MRRNTIVVANDEMARTGEVLRWLETQDLPAYGMSDQHAVETVRELKPRVVVCGDGPDGIAFCHAVRELPEPPMVVVLSRDPTVQDDVYFDGLTVIAIVGVPVRMAALSCFIATAMQITARLDRSDNAAITPEGRLLHVGIHPHILH